MKSIDERCINTIRILSAEGVQKANSGHPGLPMGAAAMAYALFSHHLKGNPKDPNWIDRDRFILSAGHGSMLIYTLLHLYGYDVSMDDLKSFRQFGSRTPGHPEYGHTPGVETTTGPLGQGVSTAVGMAIAEARLAAEFNAEDLPLIDHYTYALVGDGCMMEGIASEACSLAGTLRLSKLIVLYDSNHISIEGDTAIAFTEDVGKRFEAYGWDVRRVADGTDPDAISAAITAAKGTDTPSLIIVETQIGYGCPDRQGKASAHGEPLGAENLLATKKNLGWESEEEFHVPADVRAHMAVMAQRGEKAQEAWAQRLAAFQTSHPEEHARFTAWFSGEKPDLESDAEFWAFSGKMATRNASGELLNRLAKRMPNLIGGSADLAPSTKTYLKGMGDFSAADRRGNNLHFGVREFAMAAICSGLQLHGGLQAFCGTFFVFTDYMKHSLRLAAMMKLPVVYVLTHDSIGVGEDGPTHEPIEQLAMLRSIPGFTVFRPADSRETAAAYAYAMLNDGPTALVLTRQDLPLYEHSGPEALRGGYVISRERGETPELLLLATGSEVELAVAAQTALWEKGVDARVVSMPSLEVFERQDAAYKERVLPRAVRARLAIEAASPFGWHKYVGLDGDTLCMETFGASGPAKTLFAHFGFTVDNAVKKAMGVLGKG